MPLIGTSYNVPNITSPFGVERTNESLATGQRVNSASDDAAALSIATAMLSQSNGFQQGARNINDGISMVQVADAGLEQGGELMQRMRELATQAANGINSDSDRSALQAEFSQLQEEFSNITQSTSFNGNNMLATDGTVQIQAGDGADSTLGVQTTDMNAQLNNINFFSMDLSTQAGAASALGTLDQSLGLVSEARAEYGATQNRLESRLDVVQGQNVNTEAARSRLIDTDYAAATADRSRQQILQQANIAMQGQANASRSDVLQLLQF